MSVPETPTHLSIGGYEFRYQKLLKGGLKRWHCATKTCKAYLKTDSALKVVQRVHRHSHRLDSGKPRRPYKKRSRANAEELGSEASDKHLSERGEKVSQTIESDSIPTFEISSLFPFIKVEPLMLECGDSSSTAVNSFKENSSHNSHVIPTASDHMEKKEVYDYFGNYVASSLLQLPPENRLSAELAISQILIKEKMNAHNKSVTDTYSQV